MPLSWNFRRPALPLGFQSMKILKLGAPHRVSSFRVRLDLHRNAPFLGFLLP